MSAKDKPRRIGKMVPLRDLVHLVLLKSAQAAVEEGEITEEEAREIATRINRRRKLH